jgi:hypothetical protein
MPSKAIMSTPRHRRTAEQRAEVAKWRNSRRRYERQALEWLRQGVDEQWLLRLDAELNAHYTRTAPEPAAPHEPEQIEIDGPSRIVMAQPLDELSGSRERREEAKSWNKLSRPLPLVVAPAPEALKNALLSEFPWMARVVDRIVTELRLRSRGEDAGWFRLRPMLLVGPPAAGKSRFARRLGEIVGLATRTLNAAGSSDSRELLGTARGWSTALPAGPSRLIHESGQANPMYVVDEIDKIGTSTHNGRLTDALLTLLEAETAHAWLDEGLGRTLDLSSVNWILLANSLNPIPSPLRSRLAIVEVPRPAPQHFTLIANAMLDDIAKELGIKAHDLPPLHPEALSYLSKQFARGLSMRQLRSALGRALAVSPTHNH